MVGVNTATVRWVVLGSEHYHKYIGLGWVVRFCTVRGYCKLVKGA